MNMKNQFAFETAKGLRARMVERIQNLEPFKRIALESVGLLLILGTVYSFYLRALWSVPTCREVVINLGYSLVLLKFLAFTGWPFALVAFLDETWSSQNAGRVFLTAFITTNTFWMHKYHHQFCPFSFAFEIFPYVFSAAVGHAIGAWRQTRRSPAEDFTF
jgi:hypothetical protein